MGSVVCSKGPGPPEILGEGSGGQLQGARGTPHGHRWENLAVEGGEEGDVGVKLLRRILEGLVI